MSRSQKARLGHFPPLACIATYRFRLFIAGDTPNSVQARRNLESLCRTHMPNSHDIEVVDVFQEPARALSEGIFMTPMLVKLAPGPVLSVVGTLNDGPTVLLALGLEALVA